VEINANEDEKLRYVTKQIQMAVIKLLSFYFLGKNKKMSNN